MTCNRTQMEILPTLDLYNFTEPIATESQYILTSPRSLEACARFGIKPVELLPKTIDEFVEDYGATGESTTVSYKKFEKERLRKLRLCRQERERIIDEGAHAFSEDDLETPEDVRSSGENDNNNEFMVESSLLLKEDRSWNGGAEVEKMKRNGKPPPSILDYLESTDSYPSRKAEKNHHNNSSHFIRSHQHNTNNNSNNNGNGRAPPSPVPSFRPSSNCSSHGDVTTTTPGGRKQRPPTKIKRSQSFRVKRECSRDESRDNVSRDDVDEIDVMAEALPDTMKENLSLLSEKDRKLLDAYLFKMTGQKADVRDMADCPECYRPSRPSSRHGRRRSAPGSKLGSAPGSKLGSVENVSHMFGRKDSMESGDAKVASPWKTKYERQVSRRDSILSSIEKGGELGHEFNNNSKWQQRKGMKSPASPASPGLYGSNSSLYRDDPKSRAERSNQMIEITEKHKRAGETFQERMKQKIQQREYNKMKQAERKGVQERQLELMEKDLKLWQHELKAYQDICLNRASKVVQKRNAITSLKTHDKRHQKEMEHAIMKSRVDEEDRLRQEELKQLVNIKDTRSKMIINAKEEFANAGRESAHMPSTNNSRKKKPSSFDKMAHKGHLMSRLEGMSHQKKQAQNSFSGIKQTKNQTSLTLG